MTLRRCNKRCKECKHSATYNKQAVTYCNGFFYVFCSEFLCVRWRRGNKHSGCARLLFFGWRPKEADQNTSKRHGSKAYCNKQPTAPLRDCEANHCAGTPKKKSAIKPILITYSNSCNVVVMMPTHSSSCSSIITKGGAKRMMFP